MTKIWADILEIINKLMKSKLLGIIEATLKAIEAFSTGIKKEVEELKRKLRQYAIIFLFSLVGVFFLLFGLGFYLAYKYPALANGGSFAIIGVVSLLAAFVYFLMTRR